MAATDGRARAERRSPDGSTRQFLASAVSALLCAVPLEAAADEEGQGLGIDVDASLYYYGELGRISTFGPFLFASWEPSDQRQLSLQASVDVVTGSSPNAARRLPIPQTFSTPSGQSVYNVAADETPLFELEPETRVAGQLGYTERFGRIHSLSAHFGGSHEYDYRSLRGGLGWESELGRRNTTLGAQVQLEHAWILPIGKVPVPLAVVDSFDSKSGESREKNVLGVAVAVTQVLSRTTLAQWGYSLEYQEGYLNDPYKLVTVVDEQAIAPGRVSYLYESRPVERWRHAFGTTLVQELRPVTLRGSYRFYLDDWSISTHTGQAGLRVELGESVYGSLAARGSFQSKASFYRYSIRPGQSPEHLSADYRLGDLATLSGFVGVGVMVAEDHELRVRGGPMHQLPLADGRFPSVTAFIGHLSYVGEF